MHGTVCIVVLLNALREDGEEVSLGCFWKTMNWPDLPKKGDLIFLFPGSAAIPTRAVAPNLTRWRSRCTPRLFRNDYCSPLQVTKYTSHPADAWAVIELHYIRMKPPADAEALFRKNGFLPWNEFRPGLEEPFPFLVA